MTERLNPSTKARKIGYSKLNSLFRLLYKLLMGEPKIPFADDPEEGDWLMELFDTPAKTFVMKHTPKDKLGGPSVQKPSKSKRRRQKQTPRNPKVSS